MGYIYSDWVGDVNDGKSITGVVLYMGDTSFMCSLKKQFIVTLSTCKAEYIATISYVCHSI